MAYSCVDRVNCSMKTIKSKKINEIIQCLIAFDVFIYSGRKCTCVYIYKCKENVYMILFAAERTQNQFP